MRQTREHRPGLGGSSSSRSTDLRSQSTFLKAPPALIVTIHGPIGSTSTMLSIFAHAVMIARNIRSRLARLSVSTRSRASAERMAAIS